MSVSLRKLWNDYGVGLIVMGAIAFYAIFMFSDYLGKKGAVGSESNASMQPQYQSQAVQPAQPLGENSDFASAAGIATSMPGLPSSCSKPQISNPAELLPKDTNSQWAALNPSGKGELSNINLLKAGYHIGINTISQSMRNPNLQLRSEPPNPRQNVSIWNQSTIESDFQAVPLEIGSGAQ